MRMFTHFCNCFHQDTMYAFKTLEDAFLSYFLGIRPSQYQAELLKELENAIANRKFEQLAEIEQAHSDIEFLDPDSVEKDARYLLKVLKSAKDIRSESLPLHVSFPNRD